MHAQGASFVTHTGDQVYNMSISNTFSNNETINLKEALDPAKMDATGRGSCLEGTRQDILQDIWKWVNVLSHDANILWFHGSAGLGKSFIATSVANLNRKLCLAHLFFTRNDTINSIPNAVIRTIVYQLALNNPIIRDAVMAIIQADPAIATAPLALQFSKLLLESLHQCRLHVKFPVLIILDALDECGDPNSRRALVELISTRFSSLPHGFRFLITSRAEPDIEMAFLHQVNIVPMGITSIASMKDVAIFLRKEMAYLRKVHRYSQLPVGWPGKQVIDTLIGYAAGVFIWASTAVCYLREAYHPQRALELLLDSTKGGDHSLDHLYAYVLRSAGRWEDPEFANDFRSILGVIAVARVPLTIESIDGLLALEQHSVRILSRIRCLLQYSEGTVVRPLHASFSDYLIDKGRCGSEPWSIDPLYHHRALAFLSLQVMKRELRFNICSLETSYLSNRDFPQISKRVRDCISGTLSYACQYMTQHLALVAPHPGSLLEALEHFMDTQLLFWMETLSLLDCVKMAIPFLNDIREWCKNCEMALFRLAVDAIKFLQIFSSMISNSAPHIYVSAVPLWFRGSRISQRYVRKLLSGIQVTGGALASLPALQKVIEGHTSYVHSVAFSPDGKHIVSGSNDKTVRIWNAETGTQIMEPFEGHTDSITSVSFSPGGEYIVSASRDSTICIWDVEAGIAVARLPNGNTRNTILAAFLSDGKRVISVSLDGTARIWDVDRKSVVAGPFGERTSESDGSLLAFSPDGKRVVSKSGDSTLRVWDVELGDVIFGPLEGCTSTASIAFSPDATKVISGSWDGTMTIWGAETGSVITGPFEGHTRPIRSVAFSPDGLHVVSGSDDKTVRIWDVETGSIVAGPFEGHTEGVTSVAFSPDGRQVVSGSYDKSARIWDVESGPIIDGLSRADNSHIISVAFSPDGTSVVSGYSDGTIKVRHTETGSIVAGPFKTECISAMSLSLDGTHLVLADAKRVWVWDLETGGMVGGPSSLAIEDSCIFAFSPDGKRAVSSGDGGVMWIWKVDTGTTVEVPIEGIGSATFSADGKHIACGSLIRKTGKGLVHIWDAETGSIVGGPFEAETEGIDAVSFSPDGTRLVFVWENSLWIWDLKTSSFLTRPLQGHTNLVRSVAFSPDGTRIVSGSYDKTVRVWDVETGSIVAGPFEGHTSWVRSVGFSPDGTRVVSGSGDNTVRIWDTHTRTSRRAGGTATHEQFSASKIRDGGWMCTPSNDLLFWIPPYYRTVALCWPPGAVKVLGVQPIEFNLDNVVHGVLWTRCFVG